MMISLLITTHQRKWARNIRNNLLRSKAPEGECVDVCIVVNGEAQKADFLDLGVALERSDDDVSDARNVALAYARRTNPVGFFVFWDQDDWYGDDYMIEAWEHRHRADVIGKGSCYYELSDGRVVFLNVERENAPSEAVRGPTMSGWVGKALDFPSCNGWGEDEAWQQAMRAAGRTFYATSRKNFLGRRHGWRDHTWCIPDVDFASAAALRVELLSGIDAALTGERGREVDPFQHFDGAW
jgi:hypothetical protein